MFDLRSILISIPGVIIAVTLHEYVKSLTAYKLGDKNIKSQGRLAPNPFKHMDVLGSLFMLFFSYGWANPVRLSPFAFTNRKKAMVIIFLMPFLANFIFGSLAAMALPFLIYYSQFTDISFDTLIILVEILRRIAVFNISFAFFNLVPIYPLDGNLLISGFSPMAAIKLAQTEKILQIVLAFAIILGLVATIFDPVTNLIMRQLTTAFNLF